MPATKLLQPHTLREAVSVLNFVVVGQVRSGSAVVQSALTNLTAVTCHNDLFHASPEVRRHVHEQYFGSAPSKDLPTWWMPDLVNPYQYLSRQVFDQNLQGEQAIGVRLTYDQVDRFQFYDLIRDRCMEGDFCLVHVRRNPVACFVSQKQAQESGCYAVDLNHRGNVPVPPSVQVDPQELAQFVRKHEAVAGKVAAHCDDTLEITYRELSRNYSNTIKRTLDFIEQPTRIVPQPHYKRLPNSDLPKRIANFDELRQKVPADIREFLVPGTLY